MRSACLVRTHFILNNFLVKLDWGVPGPPEPPSLATPLRGDGDSKYAVAFDPLLINLTVVGQLS